MKGSASLFAACVCALMQSSSQVQAQWQADMRLTNNSATSYTSWTNTWCIASNGDTLHMVWYDYRDGNDEIYYKRSPDAGVSWGADIRLTNNSADSWYPSVGVSGPVVHAAWQDRRDGHYDIYYKRSTDGGLTWGSDIRLTTDLADSWQPSLRATGSTVHVVWEDTRHGNGEIYYRRSTNGGTTWGSETRVSNNSSFSATSSLSASGTDVHVVWQDDRDVNWELYYNRSTDGGTTWGGDVRLTIDTSFQAYPCVASFGSTVHVVWQDRRDGSWKIWYKRSTDRGATWGPDTRLTNNIAGSNSPSVTVAGMYVHIVWEDFRNSNWEIYHKRSTDGGASWDPDTRLTTATGGSFKPSVVSSGTIVHVVWHDERDGNFEIYYKRNPQGNPTSIGSQPPHLPKEHVLGQNYPNPFNPKTKIVYRVPSREFIELRVYDVLGREVATLVNEVKEPGSYEVTWDASGMGPNSSGLASGVYIYRLQAGGVVESKKLVLQK